METVEIKKLEKQDIDEFAELILVFEDVFEMENSKMPERSYLQNLLEKEDFFVFVAMIDGKVTGGLTAYTLHQYYSTRPLTYIYDLAVKREWQRKGIGKKLIAAITEYCKEAGMEEVFVQADKIDAYALDFYSSTGATSEEVVHFYYPLN